MEYNRIICGNCLSVINEFPDQSFDLICTSPPYAQQRKKQYGGISETDYPAWTVEWMAACHRVLKPQGSVAIVIRPHIHNGQISDYVLRTRLAVREAGWTECEELIWVKPDSPPMGHLQRPRRAWESILWFGKSGKVYCDPKANGEPSKRIGMVGKKGVGDWKSGVCEPTEGIARCRDYVEVGTGKVDKSKDNPHPAQYPEQLSSWIIKLLCPEHGAVLDPFVGSGTTAVSCVKNHRQYIGIDCSEEYCQFARNRLVSLTT